MGQPLPGISRVPFLHQLQTDPHRNYCDNSGPWRLPPGNTGGGVSELPPLLHDLKDLPHAGITHRFNPIESV